MKKLQTDRRGQVLPQIIELWGLNLQTDVKVNIESLHRNMIWMFSERKKAADSLPYLTVHPAPE